jgi:hypothetical protein
VTVCALLVATLALGAQRRDAMPFMDMVSNRFTLASFNPVLFLYPFCILSTFVVGGSLLMEPMRSFAPAGPPVSMKLLCSPVVTRHLYNLANEGVELLTSQLMPENVSSPEQSRAISAGAHSSSSRHHTS